MPRITNRSKARKDVRKRKEKDKRRVKSVSNASGRKRR